MISKADAQMAIQAAPAARRAITSLAQCTPRYRRLNAMTTHQETARLTDSADAVQERRSRSSR